jgi:hypothetical protein
VNSWPTPPFDGLLDLAQHDGVDIRPTLLRVITDGYMQNAMPTPDDQRQYTELAIRLLGETDITARAAVAARLAQHPMAPCAIIQLLARDVLEVAEPVLRHSSWLTPTDCETIIKECGPFHGAIIAERNRTRGATGTTVTPHVATPNAQENEATELCDLFFNADSRERRLIMLNLDFATTPLSDVGVPRRADIWRLELAALRHQSEIVIGELEKAIGVSNRQARRIVNDQLGEPIVAAAKAINMPADVLQRVLLFLNPSVGQSVDRVYELATLYDEISADAARRLVAIFQDADTAEQTASRHPPSTWHHTVQSARWALSEISRPPATRRAHSDFSAAG